MKRSRVSRRRFLAGALLAASAPAFVPGSALGKDGKVAASERITMGTVGWGMMGPGNTDGLMGQPDCQMVAVCDLDDDRRKAAQDTVNGRYKNQDCKAYLDYREMLARPDIDAVTLAVPDHWHGLMSVHAANAGKDIYAEKPLSHTFAEGQAIRDAVKKHQRIWQTGSWQRSQWNFRQGVELVRNGLIGKVKRLEVGLPSGHNDFAGTGQFMQPSEPPASLHYDTWIGPAQMEPYIKGRHHMNWRWNYNIGGGQLMDWIGHHCDIGHWGLGNDDQIGPLELEGVGEFPAPDAVWNTATKYRITCKYPNDIEVVIAGGHGDISSGTRWKGEDGWVYVDRGKFEASNAEWIKTSFNPGAIRMTAPEGNNHYRNFLDCVKSRQTTLAPSEVAHRSATPGHLGHIAMLLGRKIRWDAKSETIIGDANATRLLDKPFRAPWTL